jgi:hypothetical protein
LAGHLLNALIENPPGLMFPDATLDGYQLAEGTRDVGDWDRFGIHRQRMYLFFCFYIVEVKHFWFIFTD